MENETGSEIRERRNKKSAIVGCSESILAFIIIMILWVIMIGLGTLAVKICWEIIKRVWELW